MDYEGGNNDTQEHLNTAEAHNDIVITQVEEDVEYEDDLSDDFVIENSPLVVFQELHEDKILNINRNLFLNARKISYVTLVDVVAQRSAHKNNLDTFADDGLEKRKGSV